MITYYNHEGCAIHPDDDTGRCFVTIEDYEDALWDLDQFRQAIATTAEECAKIIDKGANNV